MKKRITVDIIKERFVAYMANFNVDFESATFNKKGNKYELVVIIKNYWGDDQEIRSPYLIPKDLYEWIRTSLTSFAVLFEKFENAASTVDSLKKKMSKEKKENEVLFKQQEAVKDELILVIEREKDRNKCLVRAAKPFITALESFQGMMQSIQKEIGDDAYRKQKKFIDVLQG